MIPFKLRQSAFVVLIIDLVNLGTGFGDQFAFLFRNHHIGNGNGETGNRSIFITEIFQTVKLFHGLLMSDVRIGLRDQSSELFLLGNPIVKSESLVPDTVENTTSGSRQQETVFRVSVRSLNTEIRVRNTDRIMNMNVSRIQSEQNLVNIFERPRLRRIARFNRSQARRCCLKTASGACIQAEPHRTAEHGQPSGHRRSPH